MLSRILLSSIIVTEERTALGRSGRASTLGPQIDAVLSRRTKIEKPLHLDSVDVCAYAQKSLL